MIHTVYVFVGYCLTLMLFGITGLLLSLLAWAAGIASNGETRARFFRRLIHRLCAAFIGWTSFARLFHVRFHGWERWHPGRGSVLVANHPGLTDITCLLARIPDAICIFKPDIRRNPVLGAGARRAGYLSSDGGYELVRAAADAVASGRTLIIFPEGTRTPSGSELLPLKAGFVLIARRAGVPVQLVHITCNRPVLAKERAWWKLPPLPAVAEVTLGPRITFDARVRTAEALASVTAWYHSRPKSPARVGGAEASLIPA